MKTYLSKHLFIATLALTAFCSFRYAETKLAAIFSQLRINQSNVDESIVGNLIGGGLNFPRSAEYKALIPGNRPAAVKEIGEYIKAKSKSAEFIQAYQQERENAKPVQRDKAAELKQTIAQLEKSISETETAAKTASPDLKPIYVESLKAMREQHKAMTDPNDPNYLLFTGQDPTILGFEKQSYDQAISQWNEKYPADVNVFLKGRIRQFLDLTAGIDFNAKLEMRSNRMRFVDPALEGKGTNWKLCFRAGKETITAARAFAEQWLQEL